MIEEYVEIGSWKSVRDKEKGRGKKERVGREERKKETERK